MHQTVHTSEHPIAAIPADLEIREVELLDLSRRPGSRPTEYWSARHALEEIEEEMVTGVGAATEIPNPWAH